MLNSNFRIALRFYSGNFAFLLSLAGMECCTRAWFSFKNALLYYILGKRMMARGWGVSDKKTCNEKYRSLTVGQVARCQLIPDEENSNVN